MKTALLLSSFFIWNCSAQTGLRSPNFLAGIGTPAGPAAYHPNATSFATDSDRLDRASGLTGLVDGKQGTVSFWCKYDQDLESANMIFYSYGGPGGFAIYRASQYSMYIYGYKSDGTILLAIRSTADAAGVFTVAGGWMHFMASWDLATTNSHIYVNGVASQIQTTLVNDTIDYTQGTSQVGYNEKGCQADLWLNLAEYVDLSQATNRAKFYNAGPVYLGATGQLPTGTQPIIYLPNAFGTVHNNAGAGGNFTVVGSVAACASAP